MTYDMRIFVYVIKCDVKVHKQIIIPRYLHYELHGSVMIYLKVKFYLIIMYLS